MQALSAVLSETLLRIPFTPTTLVPITAGSICTVPNLAATHPAAPTSDASAMLPGHHRPHRSRRHRCHPIRLPRLHFRRLHRLRPRYLPRSTKTPPCRKLLFQVSAASPLCRARAATLTKRMGMPTGGVAAVTIQPLRLAREGTARVVATQTVDVGVRARR